MKIYHLLLVPLLCTYFSNILAHDDPSRQIFVYIEADLPAEVLNLKLELTSNQLRCLDKEDFANKNLVKARKVIDEKLAEILTELNEHCQFLPFGAGEQAKNLNWRVRDIVIKKSEHEVNHSGEAHEKQTKIILLDLWAQLPKNFILNEDEKKIKVNWSLLPQISPNTDKDVDVNFFRSVSVQFAAKFDAEQKFQFYDFSPQNMSFIWELGKDVVAYVPRQDFFQVNNRSRPYLIALTCLILFFAFLLYFGKKQRSKKD